MPRFTKAPRDWNPEAEAPVRKEGDEALRARKCAMPNCKTWTLHTLCALHRLPDGVRPRR